MPRWAAPCSTSGACLDVVLSCCVHTDVLSTQQHQLVNVDGLHMVYAIEITLHIGDRQMLDNRNVLPKGQSCSADKVASGAVWVG